MRTLEALRRKFPRTFQLATAIMAIKVAYTLLNTYQKCRGQNKRKLVDLLMRSVELGYGKHRPWALDK
jgi:hypothetical protein